MDNLNSALSTWNDKLTEIWTLISTSPEDFNGGGVWSVIVNINDGLKAVGYCALFYWEESRHGNVNGVICPAAEKKKPPLDGLIFHAQIIF